MYKKTKYPIYNWSEKDRIYIISDLHTETNAHMIELSF